MMGKLAGAALLAGILFGLLVIVAAPFEMLNKAAAEKWPSRKGIVTLSYARQATGWRHAPWWRPEICGRYKDTGERFCIRRVRYGGFRFGDGRSESLDAVTRYPVGKEIDVYYSPVDAKETILEPHGSWREMIVLLCIGITFLILPLLLWLFRRKLEPDRYDRA